MVATLKKYGAYYFYPVTGGYGSSGVPDIIACYEGLFIAVETKAGNNKPTSLQQKNIDRIRECGGIALVINEDNVSVIDDLLTKISKEFVKRRSGYIKTPTSEFGGLEDE